MSFTKIILIHHLNNMPVVVSLMRLIYTELGKFKNARMGVRYKYWSETVVLELIMF